MRQSVTARCEATIQRKGHLALPVILFATTCLQCGGPSVDTAPADAQQASPYQIVRSAPDWSSRNPVHGLSTTYHPDGVAVRVSSESGVQALPLGDVQFGCEGPEAVAAVRRLDEHAPKTLTAPSGEQRQIEDLVRYQHDSADGNPLFWSWYADGPAGMEQGFTVRQAPGCRIEDGTVDSAIVFRIALGPSFTAQADASKKMIALRAATGETIASYGNAWAVDRTGRSLPVELEGDAESIILRVDAREAQYPVEIDPLVTAFEGYLVPPKLPSTEKAEPVAIYKDLAVVGQPGANDGSVPNGAVHIFRRVAGSWKHEDTISANFAGRFGASVAVSEVGVLVGAPDYSEYVSKGGAVFHLTYENGQWAKKDTIFGPADGWSQRFGGTLALQGKRLVVGTAPEKVDAWPCTAYIYERTQGYWKEVAHLTPSSDTSSVSVCPVALDQDNVLVGWSDLKVGVVSGAGMVSLFTKSSGAWKRLKDIAASDATTGAGFGASVAVSGDLIVVGAPSLKNGSLSQAGGFYAYRNNGSSWTFEKKVLLGGGHAQDRFGTALALHADTLLVGTKGPGKVAVYWPANKQWDEHALLAQSSSTWGQTIAMSGPRAVIGWNSTVHRIQRNIGDPCTLADQCATGFCADGVCCNSACETPGITDCMVCSAAAGAAQNGACGPAIAGTICRTSTGPCDLPETCTGTAHVCPGDSIAPASTLCRPAVGGCDLEEFCTGATKECPADNVHPVGFICATKRGQCDIEDSCDGQSGLCPETVEPASVLCRPSASECDEDDYCNGVDIHCPPNAPKLQGTLCRAAVNACDEAEACDGIALWCPADGAKPDRAACGGGECWGGVCSEPGWQLPPNRTKSGCSFTAPANNRSGLAWVPPLLALAVAYRRRLAGCDRRPQA